MKYNLGRREVLELVEANVINPKEAVNIVMNSNFDKINYYQWNWISEKIEVNNDVSKDNTTIIFNLGNNKLYINDSKVVNVSLGFSFDSKAEIEELLKDINLKQKINKIIINQGNSRNDVNEFNTDELVNILNFMTNLIKVLSDKCRGNVIDLIYCYYNDDQLNGYKYTPMSAFAQTLILENKDVSFKILDIDAEEVDSQIIINEANLFSKRFEVVKYRKNERYIRLLEGTTENVSDKSLLKESGNYIITGGMGGIGFTICKYLSFKYKANLIILGRSEINKSIDEKINFLKRNGSKIIYLSTDIKEYEKLRNDISNVKQKCGKIDGVIHLAGVIKDSFIIKKSKNKMKEVLDTKIKGAVSLHKITIDEKLDFFMTFSSTASILGNVGQADYAYANAFLDSFMHYRNEKYANGKSISINWPYWKDGGMNTSKLLLDTMFDDFGILPMSNSTGIAILENSLMSNQSQVIPIVGNNEKFKKIVSEALKKNNSNNNSIEIENTDIKNKIELYLKKILSNEIGLSVNKIKGNEDLMNYGIDSVMILNMTRILEKDLGNLSKTLFFEYKTINELVDYFALNYGNIFNDMFDSKPIVKESSTVNKTKNTSKIQSRYLIENKKIDNENKIKKENFINQDINTDIAIIGISGRYPKADNLNELWNNLIKGLDCIEEIPNNRWDYKKYFWGQKNDPGKIYSKWGGFINDVDKFDPMFFKISPSEAEILDPQERIFLETAYHAVEDAGYTRKSLSNQKVGVYVGVMYNQYQLYAVEEALKGNNIALGGNISSIANRVSFFFDLKGPSLAIDTMCSSSLTSIHLAVESILRGEIDMAIAGGVNVTIHPNKYTLLSQANMASTDGRCRSFGENGDGYVPGEGVGAIILKPLKKAIEDNDNIYGIIKGTGINHGGKTNGFTVPNPNAQSEVIKDVIDKTKISPKTLSYIEAHGTGTALGDPIEIRGLEKAYEGYLSDTDIIKIGSVKSNIGHLESAAGMASISKVLLQMKYKKLVPSIHSEMLNKNIDWQKSHFKVQTKLENWDKKILLENGKKITYPRRAAISSFGAGGSNAHVILEEYNSDNVKNETNRNQEFLFILSAQDKERLSVYINEYITFIEKNKSNINISNNDSKNISYIKSIVLNILAEQSYMDFDTIDLDITIDEYLSDYVALEFFINKIKEQLQLEDLLPQDIINYTVNEFIDYLNGTVNGFGNDDIDNLNFGDMIYTLQIGREQLNERVAIICSSSSELLSKLKNIKDSNINNKNIYIGNIIDDKTEEILQGKNIDDYVKELFENNKLEKLAELWVAGAEIDWKCQYKDKGFKKISLPVYPFRNDRYWVPQFDKVEEKLSHNDSVESLNEFTILFIKKIIEKVTKINISRINENVGFEEYGFDSIIIARLNNEFKEYFDEIPASVFFTYKNIKSLAKYLEDNYKQVLLELKNNDNNNKEFIENIKPNNKISKITNVKNSDFEDDAIAIIGVSGKYPLSQNLDEFWSNLINKKDCITEIPKERWDYRDYQNDGDGMYCKWGGFIDDYDKFDPQFFNISPLEAKYMDPNERLFIESAWECIEDSGYRIQDFKDENDVDESGNVGVFVGVSFNNYQLCASEDIRNKKFIPITSQTFSVANRVSYLFNFKGPSMSLDTACSSSLYALHQACESIRRGECEMAIAGGVNLSIHPAKYLSLCYTHFGAEDGRCHSFVEGGTGYVPGEGVGAVLLKPLSQAIKDNDNIYGKILSTSVNHDGKTYGYNVPNPVAQSQVIQKAVDKAGINPRIINVVEAHGTGTKLGDPIEIQALSEVYSKYTDEKQYCSIGALKANIGHSEAAAGISQLTKVLLELKNKKIAPTLLHSDKINENIKFENTPFYLQKELTDWNQPEIDGQKYPRTAAISSFGAGGVNVHVIVQEVEKSESKLSNNNKHIFLLSAMSEDSLIKYINKFKKYLIKNKEVNLTDLIYTLQTGRINLPYKIGFITDSVEDIIAKLDVIAEKENINVEKMDLGKVIDLKSDEEYLKSADKEEYLLDLWLKGYVIDWKQLYNNLPNKISIPTYPFDNKRFWICEQEVMQKDNDSIINTKVENDKIEENMIMNKLYNALEYERKEIVTESITEIVCKLLNFDNQNDIDLEKGFFELGMESIMIGKFKQSLEETFSLELEDSLLFNYSNILDLSNFIYDSIDFDSLKNYNNDSKSEDEKLMDLLEAEIQVAEDKILLNRGK